MSALLSVIVPVYQVRAYLSECLTSLLRQDYQNLEILVIDDCSSDGSLELAKEFEARDARFKVVRNERNMGLGATRNVGLDLATGKYILFLDSDDQLKPNSLGYLLKLAERTEADVLRYHFTTYRYCQDDVNIINKSEVEAADYGVGFEVVSEGKKAILSYFTCGLFAVWLGLYRRNFLERNKIRFPEGLLYEDVAFSMEAIFQAKRFVATRQTAYIYRVRGKSARKSITQKVYSSDIFSIHNRCLDFLEQQNVLNDDLLYAFMIALYNNGFVQLGFQPAKTLLEYYTQLRKLVLRLDALAPQLRSFKIPKKIWLLKNKDLKQLALFVNKFKRDYYATLRNEHPCMLFYSRARICQTDKYEDYVAHIAEYGFAQFLVVYWQSMLPERNWEETPRLVRLSLYALLAPAGIFKGIWEVLVRVFCRK